MTLRQMKKSKKKKRTANDGVLMYPRACGKSYMLDEKILKTILKFQEKAINFGEE